MGFVKDLQQADRCLLLEYDIFLQVVLLFA